MIKLIAFRLSNIWRLSVKLSVKSPSYEKNACSSKKVSPLYSIFLGHKYQLFWDAFKFVELIVHFLITLSLWLARSHFSTDAYAESIKMTSKLSRTSLPLTSPLNPKPYTPPPLLFHKSSDIYANPSETQGTSQNIMQRWGRQKLSVTKLGIRCEVIRVFECWHYSWSCYGQKNGRSYIEKMSTNPISYFKHD